MIYLKDILVTQNGLRNINQIKPMIKYVKDGGKFDKGSMDGYFIKHPKAHNGPVIQLAKFPDGKLFIADGHHRMFAILLAGRDFLYDNEYTVVNWTYESYVDVNFTQKWVTPFDPRLELRFFDFLAFKTQVYSCLKRSEQAAVDYILNNRHLYVMDRKNINTIEDFKYLLDKEQA